jgi:hypothetical protein
MELKLDKLDWSLIRVVIKMKENFSELFPESVLFNDELFCKYITRFIFYMKENNLTSFNYGPFEFDISNENNPLISFVLTKYETKKEDYRIIKNQQETLKTIAQFSILVEEFELTNNLNKKLSRINNTSSQ